ncbi:MAG: helix-turn-helix transcriptional regulator [Clostridia bacterium]|nr:helix-turn-helix transcriptional regulator [Clostridia bacterium]
MDIRRIKDLREDRDLLQKDVAKVLKIKQQQYSEYEIGKRLIPINYLDILATFYNTSIDYILERTNIKEPYPRNRSEK